jgi:hypothetical protein
MKASSSRPDDPDLQLSSHEAEQTPGHNGEPLMEHFTAIGIKQDDTAKFSRLQ